jgi:hypothetical protein
VTDNSTHIEFKFAKSKLNDIISQQLKVFSQEKQVSEAYRITFTDFNLKTVNCGNKKGGFDCTLEAGLEFTKDAGIFSIQASGMMELQMHIGFTINRNFGLSICTELAGYAWKKPPVVEMGSLDVSLEKLSDCAIKHFNERLLKILDEKIASSIDIASLLEKTIRTQCTNHLLMSGPELFVNICPLQIQLFDMREMEDTFIFDFWVEFALRMTSEPLLLQNACNPSFFWLENKPEATSQSIEAEISTKFLTEALVSKMNGIELGGKKFIFENTKVLLKGETIRIQSSLTSPLKGTISIECTPAVDHKAQQLKIEDLIIQINPESLLYKLTAPLVEKVLEQWIMSQFPVSVSPYFNKLRGRLPVLSILDNQIKIVPDFTSGSITNFKMEKDHIHLAVLFSNPSVQITS